MHIGNSTDGKPVRMPWADFGSHGIIIGATGAGKTWAAVSMIRQIVAQPSQDGRPAAVGVLDAKGDLFARARAECHNSAEPADAVTLNFGGVHPTNYPLLQAREGESLQQLIERRMEIFDDVLGRDGQLSLRMSRMLRSLLLLAAEQHLAFPLIEYLLENAAVCQQLAQRSQFPRIKTYFTNDFERERQTTAPALQARLDFLLRNDVLRWSFGAGQGPDLAMLMDAGRPVLINCGGPAMPRQVTRVIQSMVLSDVRQAIFTRSEPTRPYVWFIDEAQNLLTQPGDIDNVTSLLTMARSFGGHIVLMTQSLAASSPDRSFRHQLETNTRWVLLLRSGLQDADLIGPAMPISEQVIRTRQGDGNVSYLTGPQELRARLDDIVNLPRQTAYFWMRGAGSAAVKVKLPTLAPAPTPPESDSASHDDGEVIQAELDRQIREIGALAPTPAKRSTRGGRLTDVLARLDREVGPSRDED